METNVILSEFFKGIAKDGRVSATHIGVFTALLQYWLAHDRAVPLRAYSYQVMELAKLSSSKTYFRCVKDLDAFGYLRYEPSFKRNQPSKVYWNEPVTGGKNDVQ
jgi:hypothetical protein